MTIFYSSYIVTYLHVCYYIRLTCFYTLLYILKFLVIRPIFSIPRNLYLLLDKINGPNESFENKLIISQTVLAIKTNNIYLLISNKKVNYVHITLSTYDIYRYTKLEALYTRLHNFFKCQLYYEIIHIYVTLG